MAAKRKRAPGAGRKPKYTKPLTEQITVRVTDEDMEYIRSITPQGGTIAATMQGMIMSHRLHYEPFIYPQGKGESDAEKTTE